MGCTPSNSAGVYTHDSVCRDLDTCSTVVPSLKSSVSTPEKPRLRGDTDRGWKPFLSVPSLDVHGRSVSLSSHRDSNSSGCSAAPPEERPGSSALPCGFPDDLHRDSEDTGTA